MSGAGAQRVVDHHRGQRADAVAVAAQHVRFGNFFVQRAAVELDAQRVFLNLTLFQQAGGAGVLLSLVTKEAVVHLLHRLALRHAPIGQLEAVAVAARIARAHDFFRMPRIGPLQRHQILVVQLFRLLERGKVRRARVQRRVKRQRLGPLPHGFEIVRLLGFHHTQADFGQFAFRIESQGGIRQNLAGYFAVTKLHRIEIPSGDLFVRGMGLQNVFIDEDFLPLENAALLQKLIVKGVVFIFNVEEARDERSHERADADHHVAGGLSLAVILVGLGQFRIGRGQFFAKHCVEGADAANTV